MATTATGNYVMDNSTLANFKQWAMAISAAFAAFGWTQTADTGQVVWSSIASIPSNNYVYEIWQAADSFAATLPIIVRIEYGFNNTSPRIRFTVGTASNGSGTITGAVINAGTPLDVSGNGSLQNHGSTTYPCYFSGSAGEFRMMMWSQAQQNFGCVFGIERSKSSGGATTANYFTVLALGNYNNPNQSQGGQQSILASLVATSYRVTACAVVCDQKAGTGNANGTTAAYPIFPDIGQCGNPMLGFMTCYDADVGLNSVVTVATLYGSSHTFVAMTNSNQWWLSNWLGSGSNSQTAAAILMRYE